MSWSRYNRTEHGLVPPSAHDSAAPVTLFSRYPLQDVIYNTLVYSHILLALVYLPLMVWQFFAKRGDEEHVKRGIWLKFLAVLMLGGGWMLQIRHSWFSDPQIFEKHPVLFELSFARSFVSAFGSSTVISALNVFLVGVKKDASKMALNSPAYFLVLGATMASLMIIANCIVYMTAELLRLPAWSSYHWEMLWEMAVIGSVFPIYDGLNLYALTMWQRTGALNYVEHHVMNAVWTMSKTIAAPLLFAAHDAQWLWPHPGLGLCGRLAVQLLPQLALLLPWLRRILRYVAAASSYKGKLA